MTKKYTTSKRRWFRMIGIEVKALDNDQIENVHYKPEQPETMSIMELIARYERESKIRRGGK